mmetsp:Transcript_2452/g.3516  ORF Transcript_2452/g.3516 Transcript_2452/m.3516 type:complete len:226 (-) Transcript_2452:605-1282(-)
MRERRLLLPLWEPFERTSRRVRSASQDCPSQSRISHALHRSVPLRTCVCDSLKDVLGYALELPPLVAAGARDSTLPPSHWNVWYGRPCRLLGAAIGSTGVAGASTAAQAAHASAWSLFRPDAPAHRGLRSFRVMRPMSMNHFDNDTDHPHVFAHPLDKQPVGNRHAKRDVPMHPKTCDRQHSHPGTRRPAVCSRHSNPPCDRRCAEDNGSRVSIAQSTSAALHPR